MMTPKGRKGSLFAESNVLSVHITEPSRITETSATVVDQCLSNFPQFVNQRVQQPVSTNDHFTIIVGLLLGINSLNVINVLYASLTNVT